MTFRQDWLAELKGKTLRSIKTEHNRDDSVPSIVIEFTDDTSYTVTVKEGVYFEGCMINTLRKAQPITDLVFLKEGPDTLVEFVADTFPLFILLAVNKKIPVGDFPFWLEKDGDEAAWIGESNG